MSEEVLSHGGKRETYSEFVEKFKPKKTTDDCITPPAVYEAVADWVANEYGLDRADFVRPFWPGGDYEHFDYPEGCVVVDNPPFSIMSKIIQFLQGRGIDFFMFANGTTALQPAPVEGVCSICTSVSVIYENGADVSTSFVTNLEGTTRARSAPDLFGILDDISRKAKNTRRLGRYLFPDHVVTSSIISKYSKYGVPYSVDTKDSSPLRQLDAMKAAGKGNVWGGALLLSDKAAAEKAAAEKAAAEKKNVIVWQLSDRERAIVAKLSNKAAILEAVEIAKEFVTSEES